VPRADNLPASCADVKKSGGRGLNLLEPCGPVEACNGTAFYLQFNFNLKAVEYVHSGIEVRLNSSYNRPRRPKEVSRSKALFF
jgi:hypothetical protein